MNFHTYLFAIPKDDRSAFAKKIGVTVRHLENVAHGYRKASVTVALRIERATKGMVRRTDVLPNYDWKSLAD